MSERIDYRIPFACIPERIRTKYSISGFSLRPFGLAADDLAVDFNHNIRPYIATQILECCIRDRDGKKLNQDIFWDITIGKRIECLLAIATLGNSSGLHIDLRCLNEVCQEMMEVEISKKEIADLQSKGDKADSFMAKIGDKNLEIRKPTGRDQIKWLDIPFINDDAAIKGMIRTLLHEDTKWAITDEAVKIVEESMDEFDPLINFSLTICCPYCGKEGRYRIDLEGLFMQKLHEAQKALFLTVHRLASYYHWNEQAIFSIPHWRRLNYLTLIEKEAC